MDCVGVHAQSTVRDGIGIQMRAGQRLALLEVGMLECSRLSLLHALGAEVEAHDGDEDGQKLLPEDGAAQGQHAEHQGQHQGRNGLDVDQLSSHRHSKSVGYFTTYH